MCVSYSVTLNGIFPHVKSSNIDLLLVEKNLCVLSNKILSLYSQIPFAIASSCSLSFLIWTNWEHWMLSLFILGAIPATMKMQMKTMESHNQPFYYGKLGKHDNT